MLLGSLLRSTFSLGRAQVAGLMGTSLLSQSHHPFARAEQRQIPPSRGRGNSFSRSKKGRSTSPPPSQLEKGHPSRTWTPRAPAKEHSSGSSSVASSKQARPETPSRGRGGRALLQYTSAPRERSAHSQSSNRNSRAASPSRFSKNRPFASTSTPTFESSSSPRPLNPGEPPAILSAEAAKIRKPRTMKAVLEAVPPPSRCIEWDSALDAAEFKTEEAEHGQLLFNETSGEAASKEDGQRRRERNTPIRLALRIARSGLCSRRQAEKFIEQGDVQVKRAGSGQKTVVKEVVTLVEPKDEVFVRDEKLVHEPPPRVWLHYKKQHVLVTHSDQDVRGRATLFAHLRRMGLPHVISVGRLDYQSEGLLILTNSGRLARYFELPQHSFKRVYRVRIFGLLTDKKVQLLSKGLTIKGIRYKGIDVELDPEKNRSSTPLTTDQKEFRNQWLRLTLTEGKNREIRHMLAAVNIKTSRIIRIQYGPYRIQQLSPGDVREVPLLPAIRNAMRKLLD